MVINYSLLYSLVKESESEREREREKEKKIHPHEHILVSVVILRNIDDAIHVLQEKKITCSVILC
jgi:hypothetical protein